MPKDLKEIIIINNRKKKSEIHTFPNLLHLVRADGDDLVLQVYNEFETE